MSDGISRAADIEQPTTGEAIHVFGQTNGVLGPDIDEDRERNTDSASPKTFGVPPIASL